MTSKMAVFAWAHHVIVLPHFRLGKREIGGGGEGGAIFLSMNLFLTSWGCARIFVEIVPLCMIFFHYFCCAGIFYCIFPTFPRPRPRPPPPPPTPSKKEWSIPLAGLLIYLQGESSRTRARGEHLKGRGGPPSHSRAPLSLARVLVISSCVKGHKQICHAT